MDKSEKSGASKALSKDENLDACSSHATRTMKDTCNYCEDTYEKAVHNSLYCSRVCAENERKRRDNIRAGQVISDILECYVCHREYRPYTEYQKTCSYDCKLQYGYEVNWDRRSYTKKEFIEAVQSSRSKAQAITKLGLTAAGAAYKVFDDAVEALDLDTSHFTGQAWNRNRKHASKRPIEVYLTNERKIASHALKLRLWSEGLKEKVCETCGVTEWLGKPAPLCLDHINGDNKDNRLENLMILCHNCHAQTETFTGKKLRKNFCVHCGDYIASAARVWCDCGKPWRGDKDSQNLLVGDKPQPLPPKTCIDCSKAISYKSERCKSCAGKFQNNTKINWPDSDTLQKMLDESNYLQLGKTLGVSDNAIRKRLKSYPPKSK